MPPLKSTATEQSKVHQHELNLQFSFTSCQVSGNVPEQKLVRVGKKTGFLFLKKKIDLINLPHTKNRASSLDDRLCQTHEMLMFTLVHPFCCEQTKHLP